MIRSGLTAPGLTVTRIGDIVRTRKIRKLSTLTGYHNISGFENSLDNLVEGVLQRLYYVKDSAGNFGPPQPPIDGVYNSLGEVAGFIARFGVFITPLEREEFPSLYRGRKRRVYQQAIDSLKIRDCDSNDAILKAFVKYERVDFTTKPNSVPRVINPRTPRYNAALGCFIRPLEAAIFPLLKRYAGYPVVMKGYNAEQVARHLKDGWDAFHDPICVGLDAKRFDQHVSIQALEWEHNVYLSLTPPHRREELKTLLSYQLRNSVKARTQNGKLHCKFDGKRMSGDMNTSLGNCLIMCSLVFERLWEIGVDARLYNNGDDCVVFMERSDYDVFGRHMHEWFGNYGFDMEVEQSVDVFERVRFCQMQPVFDGVKYVMMRDPFVAMRKDGVSLKPIDNITTYSRWIKTVGEGGISLTGGLPVSQSYYQALINAGGEAKRFENDLDYHSSGLRRWGRNMHRKFRIPTASSRYSFFLAFGVTPGEQLVMEKYFLSANLKFNAVSKFSFSYISHFFDSLGPVE